MTIEQALRLQQFDNGYELVDGVQMHAEQGDRFQIPHDVLKKHVGVDHFVELRIDSARFSVHPDAPEKCTCPHCNEEASKPVLCHEHPASLLEIPDQNVPARGWGEQFWARITERDARHFRAVIDNPLHEARLHGLNLGDEIVFHDNHILAVHSIHREELVLNMDAADLKELARWLASQA